MSEFTLQDQIDALKYVLNNHGLRFVSIEITPSEIQAIPEPEYTFVYAKNGTLEFQYNKLVGDIDDLISGEIKRFQDVGLPK